MDRDPEDMTDDELLEEYRSLVDEGADLGARGLSIGPAVMEAGPLKREMKDRGIWGDR